MKWRYRRIVAVNDTFLVEIRLKTAGMTGSSDDVFIHCFDETLNCAEFSSTGNWGQDTGRLRIFDTSDPDGHLEPYFEANK